MCLDCNTYKPYVCKVPSEPESHAPTCESGWTYYAGKCYKVLYDKTFYGALSECHNYSGNLASIHSSEENQF
ncbi:hypothetical protein AAVH_36776 [Aphelenchoides avenae]|nr:hypothetical protein AAVH_36776 [Aphelenchus avenae]